VVKELANELKKLLAYHQATKHHMHAFARSPGYLDWATQPNPFRKYSGIETIPLVHTEPRDHPTFGTALAGSEIEAAVLTHTTISQLFCDSLAISAWKQFGSERWALRVNPSSGNLHPTEGYLVCGRITQMSDAPIVAHYAPRDHTLEKRASLPGDIWQDLQAILPKHAFLVGLSSIHWREAWKYGERAFRYCQHDVGHAIAAITVAAAGLGWRTTLWDEISQEEITALLGLQHSQGVEKEVADCFLVVYPGGVEFTPAILPDKFMQRCEEILWQGHPNVLSPDHVKWAIIDQVSAAAHKPSTPGIYDTVGGAPHSKTHHRENSFSTAPTVVSSRNGHPFTSDPPLRYVIQQRRSAVAMDGQTVLASEQFERILTCLQPELNPRMFDTLPWAPTVHLFLFVHRVADLNPGLYCLVRDSGQFPSLRQATRSDFRWQVVESTPNLGLYLLAAGDYRQMARSLSCNQDIASDGCFSMAMVADFAASLARYGPWFYPRLFWECGFIGQFLYLTAEVVGLRGTGIGCFFDDPVHELLGLHGEQYQSLYHFTVGGPVEDLRLVSLPAYG